MKKSKKTNKLILLTIIGVIVVISIVVFVLNYTKDISSLSIEEKNWINTNVNNVIDVSVYNDIPVYGQSGKGIIFSYLEEFTKAYGIQFNKISYVQDNKDELKDLSFRILDFEEKITDDDIRIYDDYYVIVSKDKSVLNNINDLNGIKLGVLDSDLENIKYYLNEASDISYVSCKNFEEMLNKINSQNKEIEYMAIPKMMYFDDLLINDLSIVYHISELYKKYVITVSDNDFLRSILNKYWMTYNDKYYDETYKKYFLDVMFNCEEISEAERMGYNGSSYVYGYVTNMPYENVVNKEFVGTVSHYLSGFEDIADVDFKVVGYNTVSELKEAFIYGEVDVMFANFDTSSLNVDTLFTMSPFEEEYVLLSKESIAVNSIRSLKGHEILVVDNTYLYDYLKSNNINTKRFSNTDELLRNINNESVVIMDRDTYEYYKNSKFRDFKIIYQNTLVNDYSFVVRDVNKNETFYKLSDYKFERI